MGARVPSMRSARKHSGEVDVPPVAPPIDARALRDLIPDDGPRQLRDAGPEIAASRSISSEDRPA